MCIVPSFLFGIKQGEREWIELVAVTLVKLVLELHPVKSQRMQESTESFHHQEYANSGTYKDNNANYKDEYIVIPAAHVKN